MARRRVILAVFACGSATATAQWTVINLHPAGATSHSSAYGVDSGKQVGQVDFHAGVWSGSAASWVDLHPAAATVESIAFGLHGGQQVGAAFVNGNDRASLWSGTPGSWVNLHPSGADWSVALAASGGQQVGYVQVKTTDTDHAALWNGTAASFIDLHPPGLPSSVQSIAEDTDGVQQVGYTRAGGGPFVVISAVRWSGSASSWVSLHPAGAASSAAYGVHGGQQVGRVRVGGPPFGGGGQAALWSGTAESWVDLKPAGASDSVALGVYDGKQVGVATIGGVVGAGVWSGTAASWVDLHAFAPAEFIWTEAHDVWHDSSSTLVVGDGFNSATQRVEALLWIGPASCSGDINGDGKTCQEDLGELLAAFGTCEGQPGYNPAANLAKGPSPNCPGGSVEGIDQSDLGVLLADYGCGGCP